jgi:hypothetical protein
MKLNKKTIKKIAIKKIMTKLETKNKWNDIFIFWQAKKREKEGEEEKKIFLLEPDYWHMHTTEKNIELVSNAIMKGDVWTWDVASCAPQKDMNISH